tara:strand:+ start:719 stop:925 length:207 start_codon:yes stop_codon:yes gene_type:complete
MPVRHVYHLTGAVYTNATSVLWKGENGGPGAHRPVPARNITGRVSAVQADQADPIDITDHPLPRSFML